MKRILIVDDEQGVLDGLRRSLRKHRGEWELEFARGGEQAIEIWRDAAFDVLVTDMKMPGVDGAQLLEHAQEHHPEAVRIVLSGHADLEPTARAIGVSHQFLAKPCDSQQLEEAIGRACGLHALLADGATRRLVGEMKALPAMPGTVSEIEHVMADPDGTILQVGEIVGRDPGIAARILQIANSPFFGRGQPTADVGNAVGFMGADLVRDLVLCEEVCRAFSDAKEVGLQLEAHQKRALRTAELARRIVAAEGKVLRPTDAFTCGVLQDVGQLVLAACCPQRYRPVLERVEEQGGAVWEVERDALGVTHAEVGAYLLGIWGLPYPIVEAVARHHDPAASGAPGLDLPLVLRIASALLAARGEPEAELDTELLEARGVADRLDTWCALAEDMNGAEGEPT